MADANHEDRHIAGHAFHAKSFEEAVAYVTRYRLELAAEHAEICICAAIRMPDGRVIRGHRHGDAITTAARLVNHERCMKLSARPWSSEMAADQGFVTSRNRYVTREEGLALQLAAGIPSACPSGHRERQLFSEDLY